jgi:organic radical activating enzyme
LSDRQNGHVIRTYGQERVEAMVESVFYKRKQPYCPKLRKVIFNPNKKLSRSEKMKIVGQLTGGKPRLTEEDLLMVIDDMKEHGVKITITKISELTDRSKHIVNQSVTEKIRNLIEAYNAEIKNQAESDKIKAAVDEIIASGDRVTMRGVKKLCSVRNYDLIKKIVHPYLNS